MKDGAKQFRRPLFGGFDRHDVTKYIIKLADERNKAIQACKDAESKHQELLDAIAELHKRNVDITRAQAATIMPNTLILETASETFARLEGAIAGLHKELEAERSHADIINAAKSMTELLPLLRKSRRLIDEIQVSVKSKPT